MYNILVLWFRICLDNDVLLVRNVEETRQVFAYVNHGIWFCLGWGSTDVLNYCSGWMELVESPCERHLQVYLNVHMQNEIPM